MKHLWWAVALVVPALTSCSQLLSLAVRNNTDAELEICNLLRHDKPCVSAKSHEQARIVMTADHPASSWAFRISSTTASKTYDFGSLDLWKLRSVPHCWGDCEVVVQLEPNGLLYWVDASRNPALPAPVQPDGFPVRPGA
jgi:hypothetical protein